MLEYGGTYTSIFLLRVMFKGFLLVELVTGLAVVAVLSCLALPGLIYYDLAHASWLTYLQLQDVINYARTEALRQNVIVYLCPAKYNRNGRLVSCNHSTFDWSQGILAFIDYSNHGPNYNSGSRVKALKFKSDLSLFLEPSGMLQINPDTTISMNGSAAQLWAFKLKQRNYLLNYEGIITLNNYGVTTFKTLKPKLGR
jgi:Tfp pilus assembly protein FimT